MKHSTDRILIAHAGSLLRPLALQSSWYRLWLLPTGVEPKAPPVYRRGQATGPIRECQDRQQAAFRL